MEFSNHNFKQHWSFPSSLASISLCWLLTAFSYLPGRTRQNTGMPVSIFTPKPPSTAMYQCVWQLDTGSSLNSHLYHINELPRSGRTYKVIIYFLTSQPLFISQQNPLKVELQNVFYRLSRNWSWTQKRRPVQQWSVAVPTLQTVQGLLQSSLEKQRHHMF